MASDHTIMNPPTETATYPMCRIPQEIYSDIMDYIPDKRTLVVLLASSRHFAPEANRRLFRSFSSNNNPQRQTLFLTALLSPTQPYRGLLVRRLSLRLTYNDPASASILTLLSLVLPHLPNLTHLTLSSHYDTDFRTVLPLTDPAPFQLLSLTLEWDRHGDPEPDPTQPQPAFLPRFLASQHALEELALPDNYYHLAGLPQTALQRVWRVWGPVDFVWEIASGRPGITHVRCEDGMWWTGPALPGGASMSGGLLSRLTVLNLSTAAERPSLGTIAAHLDVLEILVLNDFHTRAEVEDLYKIKSLELFVCSEFDRPEYSNVSQGNFEKLQNLRLVIVTQGFDEHGMPVMPCLCWSWDGQGPEEICALGDVEWDWKEWKEGPFLDM